MNETRQSLLIRAQTGETAAWNDLTALYRPLILGWLNRQDVPAGVPGRVPGRVGPGSLRKDSVVRLADGGTRPLRPLPIGAFIHGPDHNTTERGAPVQFNQRRGEAEGDGGHVGADVARRVEGRSLPGDLDVSRRWHV